MIVLKPYLSKLNFFLGNNPIIEKNENWRSFIPVPFRAVVTITADFELAWAWRYVQNHSDSVEFAIKKAMQERANTPHILSLCEEFNILITWATVGHLFLHSCERGSGVPHSELPRLDKFENEFWKFSGRDWFENDPCSNYMSSPEWYAPDLIKKILNSNIKHEIGCHTFSHIDCRDEVCPQEVFVAEINECKKEAAKFGINLKSFVHPGHTIGNLDKLAELGFTSFQSDPGNILGYPVKHDIGLWELKRTAEFVYRKEWSIDYHIYRYTKIIDRAIKYNAVCNFWFHPSFDKEFLLYVLPSIFEYINEVRDNVFISTVGNYVDWLNGENR